MVDLSRIFSVVSLYRDTGTLGEIRRLTERLTLDRDCFVPELFCEDCIAV